MGRIFETRKATMFARWNKMSKAFTRIAKDITMAVKAGGPDPAGNPTLRRVIQNARAVNMPKDKIEGAIKRASGEGEGDAYEEIRYEGYGPGGVAVIVEALTDNRNRTASEVRTAFTKNGGSLGETNSVSFQFDRVGAVTYPVDTADADAMFEAALEAGASDVESSDSGHEVICALEDLNVVREALETHFGPPEEAALTWKPQSTVPIGEEDVGTLFKLLEALEDSDDVQTVSANYDVDDEVMATLTT